MVQLREKDLPDRELCSLAAAAVRIARHTRCRVLVNGRLDVAVAAGAHGVHLPASGLTLEDVRSAVPRGFLVGVSTHSLREARTAADSGADYILLGPVFHTPAKAGYGRAMGLHRFRRIVSAVGIPVYGLGGIRPALIPAVLQAGAMGVAGIRLFEQDLQLMGRRNIGP
jgi:thiamine-phosphate pyrophosphorylase